MPKLQRPAKMSRTSSKPPSTDRKERREQSRPWGTKPGYEGHGRVVAQEPDTVVDHRPTECSDCGLASSPDLPIETVSVQEHIESPEVKPVVEQHQRLAVVCPGCRARDGAAACRLRLDASRACPRAARARTPRRSEASQPLSYERSRKTLLDLFGHRISQGGLTDMLRRSETRLEAGREAARRR